VPDREGVAGCSDQANEHRRGQDASMCRSAERALHRGAGAWSSLTDGSAGGWVSMTASDVWPLFLALVG
jgi:hypothetical protein